MTNLAFPNIVPPNDQTKFESYPGYEWAYRLTKFGQSLVNFINTQPPSVPGAVNITATTPIVVTPSPIVNTGDVEHANSGVTAGTYGDANNVAQFTVNSKGHLTSAVNIPISAGGGLPLFQQGFTYGYGEPQNALWIEFTPQTTQITGTGFAGTISPGAYTQHRRLLATSTSGSANNTGGQLWSGGSTGNVVWRGNAPFNGGFLVVLSQGVDTAFSSDSRYCVGLSGSPAALPTTQEPSAYLSTAAGALAILKDSTDTNLQLFTHNGTTGTKTDLGSSWKVNPTTDWLIITFYAFPDDTKVGWIIQNTANGTQISGTVSDPNALANNKWFIPTRFVNQGPTQTGACAMALGPYYWQNQY